MHIQCHTYSVCMYFFKILYFRTHIGSRSHLRRGHTIFQIKMFKNKWCGVTTPAERFEKRSGIGRIQNQRNKEYKIGWIIYTNYNMHFLKPVFVPSIRHLKDQLRGHPIYTPALCLCRPSCYSRKKILFERYFENGHEIHPNVENKIIHGLVV